MAIRAGELNEQELAAVAAPPGFVFLSSPTKAAIEGRRC